MQPKSKGFTLIELLIVIAIAAIMITIALPNMSQWIAARRAAGQAEQVANLMRFARAEAVRLNTVVYVCPVQIKTDGNPDRYCNPTYAGQGLAAYTDADGNGKYARNSKDLDLRTVVLNPTNGKKTVYQAETYDFGGRRTGADHVWAFLPNGTFGHAAKQSDKPNLSAGYVAVYLTDASAQSTADKKARSSVVVLDSAGRATVCSGNVGSGEKPTMQELRESCLSPDKDKKNKP